MKRRMRSYLQGAIGLGLAMLGWAQTEGLSDVRELDFAAIPLLMVVGGYLAGWLAQTPGDAKYDDDRGQ